VSDQLTHVIEPLVPEGFRLISCLSESVRHKLELQSVMYVNNVVCCRGHPWGLMADSSTEPKANPFIPFVSRTTNTKRINQSHFSCCRLWPSWTRVQQRSPLVPFQIIQGYRRSGPNISSPTDLIRDRKINRKFQTWPCSCLGRTTYMPCTAALLARPLGAF
jgi:hypothetical protein